jgi:hypothetical protein
MLKKIKKVFSTKLPGWLGVICYSILAAATIVMLLVLTWQPFKEYVSSLLS